MNNFPLAKGQQLDEIAIKLGLIRRKVWWFVKESDKSLRERIVNRVNDITDRKLSVIGVKLG